MSGWVWVWLAGAFFVHGMVRMCHQHRREGDALAAFVVSYALWPYVLLSSLGAALGAVLVKLGVK